MIAPRLPTKIKRKFKKVLVSPALSPFSSSLRGCASVLCYHRLTEQRYNGRGFYPNIYLCVRDDYFEQQIKYISKSSNVVPLNQLVAGISSSKKHQIGITFDDGYRDNLELALPILEKYNVPATIFIAAGLTDRSAPLWWEELGFIVTHTRKIDFEWDESKYDFSIKDDEAKGKAYLELNRLFKRSSYARQSKLLEILRPQCPVTFADMDLLLSWDELENLSKHPLITLGCHTVRHPILSNETEADAFNEMKQSREILSTKIKLPVDLFAYPVGGPEEAGVREFELAAKSGLTAAFTTRTGHIFNAHSGFMHCLPRITMDYFDSLDSFRWKLGGYASLLQNGGKKFVTV